LEKLSKNLATLKLKLAVSNNLPWIIDGVVIITAGVIVYYERK
jgi:hypothetical protein